MHLKAWPLAITASVLGTSSCTQSNRSELYTLYRNSAADDALRIHVATFDADETGAYNRINCLQGADLLNENLRRLNGPEMGNVRFWCEPGRFRSER